MSLPPNALPERFLARPFAHRGLHGAAGPENSMGAIRAAVEGGWAVEIDVQPSADGHVMVFHDAHLRRLTDASGPIRERTRDELRGVRLADGSEIPTLPEVLAEIAGRVPVALEIKDQDGAMGPGVGALEEAVARDLEGYDGPLAVMSFNPHSVAAMARLAPRVPRGLVTCGWEAADWPDVPEARRAELREMPGIEACGFISHDRTDLGSKRVAGVSVPVLCWTIRSEAQAEEALRHADQVTFEAYLPARA